MYCKDCKFWDDQVAWLPSVDEWFRDMRACNHPKLGAASVHVAHPNYDGGPTTKPDFGCIQFEAKE